MFVAKSRVGLTNLDESEEESSRILRKSLFTVNESFVEYGEININLAKLAFFDGIKIYLAQLQAVRLNY